MEKVIMNESGSISEAVFEKVDTEVRDGGKAPESKGVKKYWPTGGGRKAPEHRVPMKDANKHWVKTRVIMMTRGGVKLNEYPTMVRVNDQDKSKEE